MRLLFRYLARMIANQSHSHLRLVMKSKLLQSDSGDSLHLKQISYWTITFSRASTESLNDFVVRNVLQYGCITCPLVSLSNTMIKFSISSGGGTCSKIFRKRSMCDGGGQLPRIRQGNQYNKDPSITHLDFYYVVKKLRSVLKYSV